MSSEPWRTNAHSRIIDFKQRRWLEAADVTRLLEFAQRLSIDPWDILADRDPTGEFYCRIGRSRTRPGYDLCVGYLINESERTVNVISYSLVPTR